MSGRFAVTPWQLQLVSSVDIPLAGCIELTQEHGLGRNELGLTSSVISRKAHVMFYCDASRYVRVRAMHANPIRILRADARGNIEIGRDHRSGDSAVVFPGDLLQIGDLVAKVDGKVWTYFLQRRPDAPVLEPVACVIQAAEHAASALLSHGQLPQSSCLHACKAAECRGQAAECRDREVAGTSSAASAQGAGWGGAISRRHPVPSTAIFSTTGDAAASRLGSCGAGSPAMRDAETQASPEGTCDVGVQASPEGTCDVEVQVSVQDQMPAKHDAGIQTASDCALAARRHAETQASSEPAATHDAGTSVRSPRINAEMQTLALLMADAGAQAAPTMACVSTQALPAGTKEGGSHTPTPMTAAAYVQVAPATAAVHVQVRPAVASAAVQAWPTLASADATALFDPELSLASGGAAGTTRTESRASASPPGGCAGATQVDAWAAGVPTHSQDTESRASASPSGGCAGATQVDAWAAGVPTHSQDTESRASASPSGGCAGAPQVDAWAAGEFAHSQDEDTQSRASALADPSVDVLSPTATLGISSWHSSFGATPGGTPDEPWASQPADGATPQQPSAATVDDGSACSLTPSENARTPPTRTQPARGVTAILPLIPPLALSLVCKPFELDASVLVGTSGGHGTGDVVTAAPPLQGEQDLDVTHAATLTGKSGHLRSTPATQEGEGGDERVDGLEQASDRLCGAVSDITAAVLPSVAHLLTIGEPSSTPIKEAGERPLDAAFARPDAPPECLSSCVVQFGFSPLLTGNKRKERPEKVADELTGAAAWSISNLSPFALDRKRFLPSPK